MENLLIYLLKASTLLSAFWLIYRCFLNRTTFFKQNRFYLIFGIITASILPLIQYKKVVLVESTNITANGITQATHTIVNEQQAYFEIIISTILVMYLIGVLFFFIRLNIQLLSLYHCIKKGRITKREKLFYVQLDEEISPFSFFKYLVYNPKKYTEEELETILKHERIHSEQLHSIDVLLVHLYTVVFWFNPFSWLYKKAISENLEYLTDKETTKNLYHSKSYQYLLLKQLNGIQYSIINPFYNSLIKKRIVMLQKQKSNKAKLLRYALVIPFLIGFMMLYSFKTETKLVLNDEITRTENKDVDKKPLVVINGEIMPSDFDINSIAPEDIESIDVLKEKSATKKYGKKGENGVIEITLKKTTPYSPYKITGTSEAGAYIDFDPDKEQPLIIVDEEIMPNDFDINSIDPTAIKQVSVLKDKVAVEKYGKKGEHGVVEVNLKNTSKHKVTKISKAGTGTPIEITKDKAPLHIIDGKTMPIDFNINSISPESIKEMFIIKDESATVKYGEKGKNGVILISTKSQHKE